jgi:hypothetical protein
MHMFAPYSNIPPMLVVRYCGDPRVLVQEMTNDHMCAPSSANRAAVSVGSVENLHASKPARSGNSTKVSMCASKRVQSLSFIVS